MSIPKIRLLLVPLIVVVSLAVAVGLQSRSKNQVITVDQPLAGKVQSNTKTAQEAYVPGLPVRLIIPKISVDASIESLGLTPDGDMDAPKNIINAGWYNSGPRAGSPGTAVMDGHYGAVDGMTAVFDNLHTLQKGDLVYVKDSNSGSHTYVVRDTRLFQPEDDASVVFRSDDNKARLNLITCQGEWEDNKESYSQRLVVFTDLIEG